jgi:hypothetical protein
MSGAAARRIMHNYGLPAKGSNLTNDQLLLLDEINPTTIISTLTFMNGFVCVSDFLPAQKILFGPLLPF